jgi:hypothetical protein
MMCKYLLNLLDDDVLLQLFLDKYLKKYGCVVTAMSMFRSEYSRGREAEFPVTTDVD